MPMQSSEDGTATVRSGLRRGRPAKAPLHERLRGLPRIASSDAQGRRALVSFQCAPDLARRLVDIRDVGLATGRYPWRTRGEVVRYLVTRGFEKFAKDVGIDDDALRFHQVDTKVEAWRIHREAAQTLVDTVTTELQALIQIDETNEATQRLHLIVPDILDLESVVWREWVIRQLKLKFPGLMGRAMPAVPLAYMGPRDVLKRKRKKKGGRK